jgi:carbonic anhydrase
LQPNWSYQLTASAGPKSWSTLKSDFKACGDPGRQSPIELASSKTNAAHHALKFQYVPLEFTLTNNGMWTVLQPANSQNTIFWKDQTYHFEHAQLRSPGEHTIKGVRADLELQLYHRSKSGQRVAVAAQLTERAEAEHPVLKSLLQHIPTTQSESAKAAIDIAKLLPIHHDFYNYTGSVTFPPCTSNVEWFVLKEPVAISGAQVDYFASIFKTPAARPVQSHSTQAIAESASAADVTGH